MVEMTIGWSDLREQGGRICSVNNMLCSCKQMLVNGGSSQLDERTMHGEPLISWTDGVSSGSRESN